MLFISDTAQIFSYPLAMANCGNAHKFNKSTTQFAIFKAGIFYIGVFYHIKTQWKPGS